MFGPNVDYIERYRHSFIQFFLATISQLSEQNKYKEYNATTLYLSI